MKSRKEWRKLLRSYAMVDMWQMFLTRKQINLNFCSAAFLKKKNCRQGIIVTLQTWVPAAGIEVYQRGNVLHITRGRREITIYTPPISLSGANTLQNKSQRLTPNLVWQRVAACAILGPLWCQSPISPVTFFQRKSRFPRDSALCNFHSLSLHAEWEPSSSLLRHCSPSWPEKTEN